MFFSSHVTGKFWVSTSRQCTGATGILAGVLWNSRDGIYFPGSCARSLPLRRALEVQRSLQLSLRPRRSKLELRAMHRACTSPSLLRKQHLLRLTLAATRNNRVSSKSEIWGRINNDNSYSFLVHCSYHLGTATMLHLLLSVTLFIRTLSNTMKLI